MTPAMRACIEEIKALEAADREKREAAEREAAAERAIVAFDALRSACQAAVVRLDPAMSGREIRQLRDDMIRIAGEHLQ